MFDRVIYPDTIMAGYYSLTFLFSVACRETALDDPRKIIVLYVDRESIIKLIFSVDLHWQ